jgi:hypothetical protein
MSTGTEGSGGAPLAPALVLAGEIDVTAEKLASAELWQLDDHERADLLTCLETAQRRIDSARMTALRDMEARGGAASVAATSTTGWLRGALQARPARAHSEVRLAVALDRYPHLAAALGAGAASADQVQVCVAALDELPIEVTVEQRERAELHLVELCASFDPVALKKLGKHLLHVLDPDGSEVLEAEERRAAAREELRFTRTDGGFKVAGFLRDESYAMVGAAIDPLAAPCTGADGPDLRTAPQRNAEALVELSRRALTSGGLPTQGMAWAQLTVTADLETLHRAVGAFGGELDRTGPVSVETVRRIACDAEVIPVVLGGSGQPLDVGRAQRTFPRSIRRALAARDRGCAFPGCDRPVAWAEAHHIVHWIDGGITSLDNGVLLCRPHHNVIHHTPWSVRIDERGLPVFTPPRGHGGRVAPSQVGNHELRRRMQGLNEEPRGP